jgi:phage gpG-like protein
MAGLKLLIAVKGFSKASKKLERGMKLVKNPSVPMRQAAVWLVGQTIKVFDDQGHPEKWAPLSLMTLFIKAHRANGPKDIDPQIGSDTGRLKGSFIPVVTEDESKFGASTNVEYAADFNGGSVTESRDVAISSFIRKRGARQARDYARGSLTKASERVRAYILHLKGGMPVPPRQFFPNGVSELDEWGYLPKIRKIFSQYFNQELGGLS